MTIETCDNGTPHAPNGDGIPGDDACLPTTTTTQPPATTTTSKPADTTTTTAPATTTTVVQAPPPPPTLPGTGAPTDILGVVGILAVAVGATIGVRARRFRRATI